MTRALEWAAERRTGTLITIREDGRPQSSDIGYAVVNGTLKISVTDDRAKTANMRRDPRVVIHLSDPASWSYLSFDGRVDLTTPTTAVDDQTSDALVDYYERVAGQHPDWAEYRRAMVEEKRLVVTFTPNSVVGQIN